jgi:alpha-glucosidase (family GH31 glycosyl hydrolase)
VTLPERGNWTYLFGAQTTYPGGQVVDVTVPLAEYPAFVRAGSALVRTLLP